MNKLIWLGAGFLSGAVAGIFAGKKLAEDAAEAKARDEIEQVKKAFRKEVDAAAERKTAYEKEGKKPEKKAENNAEPTMKEMKPGSGITEKEVQEYREKAGQYNTETVTRQEKEIREMAAMLKPQIIDDAEIGMKEEYGTPLQLTYYADGSLTDEENKLIDPKEATEMLGTEWAEWMKIHDTCAVINNKRRCYYEITAVAHSYDEELRNKPYLGYQ